jgi:type IX secretion system PorP/SprF family membrane protein
MRRFFAISLLVLTSSLLTPCKAQDPTFSQPYANPLYLNPAFAGTGTSQRIGLNFRDQWPGIPGNFYDYGFSYDRNIIDSSFGIGVLGLQDRAGDNTLITTSASLILAYQFHIKSFTLSVGAQGTFQQKTIDQSNLVFGDMLDPRRGFVYTTSELLTRTTTNVADFSAGLLGYGKYYFAGFAVDHFTQPDISFTSGDSPLPIKLVFNGGGMIPMGSFTLSPTLLYQKQQDFNMEVGECYLSWKYFTLGVGYNWNNAMIFAVGFQNKFLRLGYSYDYVTSQLTNTATAGSHEVSLAILLRYKCPKLKKVIGINCPAF